MCRVKVSVIVPVYNVEPYIRRCLSSLIHQTLQDIEIICIDDKGDDNSFRIAEEFARADKRIRLVYNDKNMGIAACERKGLHLAKGEYVGFVDPDDWIDTAYYQKLYEQAQLTRSDIAKADRLLIWADKITDPVQMNRRIYARLSRGLSLFSSWIFGWTTAIYRRKFLQKYDITIYPLNLGFDVLFLAQALSHKPRCVLVDDVFYYYVQRSSSITKRTDYYTIHSEILYLFKLLLIANDAGMQKYEYTEFVAARLQPLMTQLHLLSDFYPKETKRYQNLIAEIIYKSPHLDAMYEEYPARVTDWSLIVQFLTNMQDVWTTDQIQKAIDDEILKLNKDGGQNANAD